ncbi:PREDICTED: UPF0481 [Prunus dulcis]|uniref:PREDICTED: UPF0481 n=1 Tax=Prunus dulcis TaxID=3755 RepID=A0A5E4GQE4_PRUDU|nr:UPF0481 protein At3g47200-like [Prunus dulcis]VVA41833.1 PREDICTED: UPF0481 [Prunus dulcis]
MEDQISEPEHWADAVQVFHDPDTDTRCIYRVPNKLRKVNEAAYTPQLISIGPFHHGKPELKDMETHKIIYCDNFFERSSKTTDELKHFIEGCQEQILRCYAGTISQVDNYFRDVILRDAGFIIELFLTNSENPENYYHILRSPWLRKAIEQDLILFENQLPYFILEDLYNFAKPKPKPNSYSPSRNKVQARGQANRRHRCIDLDQICYCLPCCRPNQPRDYAVEIIEATVHPFLKLTCEFFNYYGTKENSVRKGLDIRNFTDLVRHFLCPAEEMTWVGSRLTPIKNIYDARKLKAAGVNFRLLKEAGFVVKGHESHHCNFNSACFTSMDLKLTQFCVKDETECVIRNVMALEQFLYPECASICEYFLLMDKLVDTVEDVNLLIDSGVVVNNLGSNERVTNLINQLCEQIMDDVSCYGDLCDKLNKHYGISFWNRHVALLKRVYFKDLWTASSTILGIFVLVFSIFGTIKSLKS